MDYYADSSFLVSCYVVDANTPRARDWLSRAGVPLAFTALHALEVRNSFKLGVFRGLFPAADAAAAWRNVESDLHSGRLAKITVKWPVVFRVATRLVEGHSVTTGTRSLDVLHIAAAKAARAVEFLSFDTRQRALAALVGLRLAP
jgi:predicted nucleic acid-binding protein